MFFYLCAIFCCLQTFFFPASIIVDNFIPICCAFMLCFLQVFSSLMFALLQKASFSFGKRTASNSLSALAEGASHSHLHPNSPFHHPSRFVSGSGGVRVELDLSVLKMSCLIKRSYLRWLSCHFPFIDTSEVFPAEKIVLKLYMLVKLDEQVHVCMDYSFWST